LDNKAIPDPAEQFEPETTLVLDPPSFEEVNAAMTVAPVEESVAEWAFNPPSEEAQLLIQEALAKLDVYPGKKNGKWGQLSIFGIQAVVANLAAKGSQTVIKPGVPDAELCVLVRKYAIENGGYKPEPGAPKAVLNEDIWLAFLNGLERGAA